MELILNITIVQSVSTKVDCQLVQEIFLITRSNNIFTYSQSFKLDLVLDRVPTILPEITGGLLVTPTHTSMRKWALAQMEPGNAVRELKIVASAMVLCGLVQP